MAEPGAVAVIVNSRLSEGALGALFTFFHKARLCSSL
jgi:hypothetical protein